MRVQFYSNWKQNWDWRTDCSFRLLELRWWNDEARFVSITLFNFTLAVILREAYPPHA